MKVVLSRGGGNTKCCVQRCTHSTTNTVHATLLLVRARRKVYTHRPTPSTKTGHTVAPATVSQDLPLCWSTLPCRRVEDCVFFVCSLHAAPSAGISGIHPNSTLKRTQNGFTHKRQRFPFFKMHEKTVLMPAPYPRGRHKRNCVGIISNRVTSQKF